MVQGKGHPKQKEACLGANNRVGQFKFHLGVCSQLLQCSEQEAAVEEEVEDGEAQHDASNAKGAPTKVAPKPLYPILAGRVNVLCLVLSLSCRIGHQTLVP